MVVIAVETPGRRRLCICLGAVVSALVVTFGTTSPSAQQAGYSATPGFSWDWTSEPLTETGLVYCMGVSIGTQLATDGIGSKVNYPFFRLSLEAVLDGKTTIYGPEECGFYLQRVKLATDWWSQDADSDEARRQAQGGHGRRLQYQAQPGFVWDWTQRSLNNNETSYCLGVVIGGSMMKSGQASRVSKYQKQFFNALSLTMKGKSAGIDKWNADFMIKRYDLATGWWSQKAGSDEARQQAQAGHGRRV